MLPFSPEARTPFEKVYMHTVKVNKEVSSSGWKTFVCPTHNKKDGELMGTNCPFCKISARARELKSKSLDEPTKKKYGDVEFINRVKEMWIVRCIERDHEEDGVKFWLFNASKDGKGVYDQIMGLFKIRREAAARKGNEYNIFDVKNGLDLIINISRNTSNKTSIQVFDSGIPSPLSEDENLLTTWLEDNKKWYEVYTVKPYEFMEIIAEGGVPVFNKELNKYVDRDKANEINENKSSENSAEESMEEAVSVFTNPSVSTESSTTNDENNETENEEEDLPF